MCENWSSLLLRFPSQDWLRVAVDRGPFLLSCYSSNDVSTTISTTTTMLPPRVSSYCLSSVFVYVYATLLLSLLVLLVCIL